jgi:hypothetical protein
VRRALSGSLAAALLAATAAACSSSGAPSPIPTTTYSEASSVLTALWSDGVKCLGAGVMADAPAPGSTQILSCNSSADKTAQPDTAVATFDSHADAAAFAGTRPTGLSDPTGGQLQAVVGGNWTVVTVAPFGTAVQQKIGGQLVTPGSGS